MLGRSNHVTDCQAQGEGCPYVGEDCEGCIEIEALFEDEDSLDDSNEEDDEEIEDEEEN